LEGNKVFHCLTGGPYHDTWGSKDVTVRNNYHHDVITGPYQNIGPGVSTTNAGIALKSLQNSGLVATAETFKPHGLLAGTDTVNISGASNSAYNGSKIPVKTVPTATTFTYDLASNPGGPATGASYLIGEQYKLVESLTRTADATGFTVTAKTTYDRHGFLVGDAVKIIKAGHFNPGLHPNATLYRGSFTITSVPDEKTFCYHLDADPGVDSCDAGFAAGYFGRIWQSRISVYEENVFELSSRFGDEATPFAIGLSQYDPSTGTTRTNPFTYSQLVARGNIVRPVDARYGLVNSSLSSAVIFNSSEKVLVEGNIIDVDYPTPINFSKSGAVLASYNLNSSGAPIRGLDHDASQPIDDMARKIQDALVLSLL